jgi:hypothetical protein
VAYIGVISAAVLIRSAMDERGPLTEAPEFLEPPDGSIAVSSDALVALVVSDLLVPNVLVSAGPDATRPDCQPTTTAVVAPTPTATKNPRSIPATYIKYLNEGESALSRSIISYPLSDPVSTS